MFSVEMPLMSPHFCLCYHHCLVCLECNWILGCKMLKLLRLQVVRPAREKACIIWHAEWDDWLELYSFYDPASPVSFNKCTVACW